MGEKCSYIDDLGKQCGMWAGEDGKCRHHRTPKDEIKQEDIKVDSPGLGIDVEVKDSIDIVREEKPKVKVTKPWSQGNNPWSQDLLAVPKRKGFRQRLVLDKPENVQKYQSQGWVVANKQNYGGMAEEVIGESGKMDTTIRRRELLLMEMPEELAQQRDSYMKHKANSAIDKANKIASEESDDIERRTGERILTENKFTSSQGNY